MKQYELNLTLDERDMYVLWTMMLYFIDDNINSHRWRDLSNKIQKSIENELSKSSSDFPEVQKEYEMNFINIKKQNE